MNIDISRYTNDEPKYRAVELYNGKWKVQKLTEFSPKWADAAFGEFSSLEEVKNYVNGLKIKRAVEL